MARIPTTVAQRSLDTGAGTIPNTRLDTSAAQALAGFGSELSAIGERMVSRERQQEDFLAQQRFLQLDGQVASDVTELQRNMDPTGKGFHDGAMGAFDARSQEFLGTLPPRLHQQYAERVKTLGIERGSQWAGQELGQWDVYQTDETGKMLNQLATGITQFGQGSMEDYLAQGEEIINATNLPPIKKAAILDSWRQTAQTTALISMPPEERKRALGDALGISIPEATGSVVERIVGVESGGSATAKNPNSSATGAGQFIESTWINMIRKYRPDIAQGRSRSQILALRNVGNLSREMVGRYAEENAAQLQAAGFQPSPGNVYLAHFLGPQGAIDMLRADPNADASSVNPAAARANPSIFSRKGASRSAAQVVAWAEKKMGGTRGATEVRRPMQAADPRFADVPLDTRLKLIGQADNEINAARKEAEVNLNAVQAQEKDSFALKIATGDTGLTSQDILSSGLDDGDKATLINSLNAKRKEDEELRQFLSSVSDGSSVNPLDTKAQGFVDKAFDEQKKLPQADQRTLAEDWTSRTGIVPKPYMNDIRAALAGDDVRAVTQALQRAQRLRSASPTAFMRDGGSEVEKAAVDFRHFTEDLGLTPEQAARRHIDLNDPEKKRQRAGLETEANKLVSKITEDDVSGAFDGGLLDMFAPDVGFSNEQKNAIVGDYQEIFRTEFLATGDENIAKARASEQMKRLYNETNIAGSATLMKYPPETFFPAIDGSHDYLGRLLLEAGKEATGRDYQEGQLFIVSTPQTGAEIRAGKNPSYQVWSAIDDENGFPVYDLVVKDAQWTPDVNAEMGRVTEDRRQAVEAERERTRVSRENQADLQLEREANRARAEGREADARRIRDQLDEQRLQRGIELERRESVRPPAPSPFSERLQEENAARQSVFQ